MVNQIEVAKLQTYRPSISVVVNYESAPQHEALLQLEIDNPGSSIPAMDITATQCETAPNNLHWCPPFTKVYDPMVLGTWDWIANRLGDMPGSVNLQISMSVTRMSTGYEETLTVTNRGTAIAGNVIVDEATLGSGTCAALPALLGDLPPNQSVSVTLDFPDSAGAPNTRTTAQIAGTYNGGTFGGTQRTILPS